MQGLPISHGLVPFHTADKLATGAVCARRHRAAFDISNGFFVDGYQTCTCTGFDGHVAQGHAAFHAESTNSGAAEFDGVARAAGRADLADDG